MELESYEKTQMNEQYQEAIIIIIVPPSIKGNRHRFFRSRFN